MEQARKLIVVVDDEPRWRELLLNTLRASKLENCRVVGVEDGRQALSLINELKPQCVLLDYLLPDMQGAELLRAAAPTLKANNIAVVMMSSQEDPSAAAVCMQLGASRYISKSELGETAIVDVLLAAIAESEREHLLRQRNNDAADAAGILDTHVLPVLAIDARSRELCYQNQAAKSLGIANACLDLLAIPQDLTGFTEYLAGFRENKLRQGDIVNWQGQSYRPIQHVYVGESHSRLVVSLIKA